MELPKHRIECFLTDPDARLVIRIVSQDAVMKVLNVPYHAVHSLSVGLNQITSDGPCEPFCVDWKTGELVYGDRIGE